MKTLQVRTVTDLTIEPVTLTEAKLFCKVSGTDEDELFHILIKSARQAMEQYTQSSFGEKTLHATWLERTEDNLYELPYGPVISVDKVFWVDEEGTEEQATINSDFWVYGDQDAIVRMGMVWSTGTEEARALRFEYTAGYGHTNTETLPADLKKGILKQIVTDYENREDIGPGGVILCNASKKLAAPYRKKIW